MITFGMLADCAKFLVIVLAVMLVVHGIFDNGKVDGISWELFLFSGVVGGLVAIIVFVGN